MKKNILLIIGLILCNSAFSKDYTIGKKLKMVSADGFTKANTGEKIYSRDKNFKIEGDWSEKFVLGHGDCGTDTTWSDCRSDRSRVEKEEGYSKAMHKWYKFSFFIPEDYPFKANGNKAILQMIAQVKATDSREPIWRFDLFQEGGNPYRFESAGLNMKFGLSNDFHQAVTCTNILSWTQMLGKWNEIVLFVNYKKKPTEWLSVGEDKYFAGLWINGERAELECAEQVRMPKGILGKYRSLFNKKGSQFSYGTYLTRVGEYILSEMEAKNMCVGKDKNCGLAIEWRKDKGGDAMNKTEYIKNWTEIDWPIKLETRRIWFDNQDVASSNKNIWNMPLTYKVDANKKKIDNTTKFLTIVIRKSDPSIEFRAEDETKGKANVKAMKKCLEKYDDCSIKSSGTTH
jgi:hypothetical protein